MDTNNQLLKAGSIPVSPERATENQPFASGTGNSQYFRIPSLLALPDGTLVAAADARWETTEDGGGLDTIASVSSDGGKTWHYSFPIYYPDSNGYAGTAATTVIDPVMVRDADGTIYCMADVNPTGVTTYYIYTSPGKGTGYVTIQGVERLPLTSVYDHVNTAPTEDDLSTYEYYVGDFDEHGFAPVLRRADHSVSEYGVDAWFNLYSLQDGVYTANLTQKQVNADTVIQQNAFYKDSVLHVYNTGYMLMVSSKDDGKTWENPVILNPQIKYPDEVALLVSPGRGLLTDKGDLLIPFYTHGQGHEFASFIYSSDHGKTWKRTNNVDNMASSESELIELPNGDIRMFYRNYTGHICYADAKKTANGDYTFGKGTELDVSVESTCNLSAINYSRQIDGKPVAILACPGGPERKNGKIFGFTIEADNSMTLIKTLDVPDSENGYCYSCIAELPDGAIALLWEPSHSEIRYHRISFF